MKYSLTALAPASRAWRAVATISSAVMFLLITSRSRWLPASGAKVKLLRPGPHIQRTLTLTQLLPLLEVYDDEVAAVASFQTAWAGRISTEDLGDLLVDPRRDFSRRRRPAHGVRDVRFDLLHAFVAVLEHALVPLRIEHAGPRLECDLLSQRADRVAAAGG